MNLRLRITIIDGLAFVDAFASIGPLAFVARLACLTPFNSRLDRRLFPRLSFARIWIISCVHCVRREMSPPVGETKIVLALEAPVPVEPSPSGSSLANMRLSTRLLGSGRTFGHS